MGFGRSASQWEQDREAESSGTWIRGMKNGENKLRILDEVDDWVAYREHYDSGIRFFPCAREEGQPRCVGCEHPSDDVRDRTRKFAFNALNDKDELVVAKVGKRVYDTMQIRRDRSPNKTIVDRDFIITRSGKGQDTSYDVEGLAPQPLDDDGERIDIYALLEDKYEQAVKWYGSGDRAHPDGDVPEPSGDTSGGRRRRSSGGDASAAGAPPARSRKRADAPDEAQTAAPAEEPKKAAPAKRTRAAAKPAAAVPEPEPAQQALPESNGEMPDFGDMDKIELQSWLDDKGVEYADNAPRSVLVMLCEKSAA